MIHLLAPAHRTDPPGLIERQPQALASQLGLAPSTVSEHLRKLATLQLVTSRRQGRALYYRLNDSPLLASFLTFLFTLEDEAAK